MTGDDLAVALANGAARIRLALAGRTTDVELDLLDLVDDWIESFEVWKAGTTIPVRFAASTTMALDEFTARLVAPTPAVMPDLTGTLAELGAAIEPVELLARLGEEIHPLEVGVWFHVGGDGVDAGWAFPGQVTVGELRRAGAPTELTDWVERSGAWAVTMLEGSLGSNAYLGGALLLSEHDGEHDGERDGEHDGVSVERIHDALGLLGVELPPASLLVPIEEIHRGAVWITAWFLPGEGVVRTGVAAIEPDAELLVAAAMATSTDEERLARFGAALGSPLPAVLEVETWAHGSSVRLHYDARSDGLDDEPFDDSDWSSDDA